MNEQERLEEIRFNVMVSRHFELPVDGITEPERKATLEDCRRNILDLLVASETIEQFLNE